MRCIIDAIVSKVISDDTFLHQMAIVHLLVIHMSSVDS